MFIGHYAVGFALKKKATTVPLWLLFVSVQFVDILAFLFILLGIEKITYNPVENPFLRTILEFVPYSHSLLSNAILSLLVLLIFWKFKTKEWGITLSIGVFSHWFIDTLAHAGDMPLLFNELKVGLGLWHFPWVAYLLEIFVFLLAGYYLLKNYKEKKRHIVLIIILSAGFSSMFFAPEVEVSSDVTSITSLVLYATFTILAYWSEREIKH